MSNLKISTPARNAAADGVVDLIDADEDPGYIQIRSGGPPANPAAANIGDLLATLVMSDPAFGAAVNGVATADAITGATAVASGEAGHFRIFDGDDVCILQGTAGEAGDSPDMVFDDKDIIMGGNVEISSMTVTMPEGGS